MRRGRSQRSTLIQVIVSVWFFRFQREVICQDGIDTSLQVGTGAPGRPLLVLGSMSDSCVLGSLVDHLFGDELVDLLLGQSQDIVEYHVVVLVKDGRVGVAALRYCAEYALHGHLDALPRLRVVYLYELAPVLELRVVGQVQVVLGRACGDSHGLELLRYLLGR